MVPSEEATNNTLDLLRANIDEGTIRTLENGRKVANVVVPKGEALNRFISEKSTFSMGTVSTHISALVRAGYVEPGSGRGFRGPAEHRWVCLDGAFRHSDLPN